MSLLPATLRILKDLVAFDSVSSKSNLPIAEYIRDYLAGHGIAASIWHEGDKANLFARIGPEGKGGIVLSGHMDVVPVAGQEWSGDPFTLREENGAIFGRGTADMKGFLACALALAPELKNLKQPVYLAFTHDEEVGCLGAPGLIREVKKLGIAPDLVLVGEPTEMRPANAHKGIHSFETKITGKASHSSMPHLGINAVTVGCKLVGFLETLAANCKAHAHGPFDPPHTTIHVGVIEGGVARNIVPEHCRFLWEIRLMPGEDSEHYLRQYRDHCSALAKETGATIETRELTSVPGLEQKESPLLNRILHTLGTNGMESVSFSTEAGLFQRAGFPAIICGPGSIKQAHKPDEWVSKEQLDICLNFLMKFTSA